MPTIPPQITERHLSRRAVAYVRQSTLEQVRDNVGSTALQRELPELLQSWGWKQDQIDLIDDDLGVSGSLPGSRKGFAHLLKLMEAGVVGIVAVTDPSRLSRNFVDLARFVTLAQQHDVLLAQGNQIIDYAKANDAFIGVILGANAARENQARVELSTAARRKKAEAGLEITRPPLGYVVGPASTWVKDPDPRVREVIQLIFDKFFEFNSMGRLWKYFILNGILLPHRVRHELRWSLPRRGKLLRILKNEKYCGTFIFGKTRSCQVPNPTGEYVPRPIPQPAAQWIRHEHHHEPYLTPERWAFIQRQLGANRSTVVSPLGRGAALVQGLVYCGVHGYRMYTTYPTRRGPRAGRRARVAVYRCVPATKTTETKQCLSVHARLIDHLVEREVLAAISPPSSSLALVQDAMKQALRDYETQLHAREDDLRRAERAVAEAERLHEQVDPRTHPHVKQRLVERLETSLRARVEIHSLQLATPLPPPVVMTEDELKDVYRLASDLPHLWNHPQVTHEDRKAIVRAAIKAIRLTRREETMEIVIEWGGGARTSLSVPHSAHVRSIVRSLYDQGLTADEIARRLPDSGVVRRGGLKSGLAYDRTAVRLLIHNMGLRRSLSLRAYDHIRTRTLQGLEPSRIADELNAAAIRPYHCSRWTKRLVQYAIQRLRRGCVRGLEPLPAFKRRHRTPHKPNA
jgi:DNA invertase Pin-like site-specific DNA recombinase